MTPSARHAAAIELIDRVLAGAPAEKALTAWARASRFAGAKDRAAVRDLVFDSLRRMRSWACLGGAMTGRGIVLGGLREQGVDPDAVFSGARHAPPPLSEIERDAGAAPQGNAALDCPDWLAPDLQASLGADFAAVMAALRQRAPMHLRVNLRKSSRAAAAECLAGEGVATRPHPLSPAALEVISGGRALQSGACFAKGWVEPQDAASQAVADALPIRAGAKVLDYCAGGGGKSLAMAGRVDARYFAWDAAPNRMRDLPVRARRAGVGIVVLDEPSRAAPYDLVLCDAPCSGSGAWRRSPEAKWHLDAAALTQLEATQAAILDAAAALVAPGGVLAYATCSLLNAENAGQIGAFCARHRAWRKVFERSWTPLDGGDGFYASHLTQRQG